jgi:hypothetical protein
VNTRIVAAADRLMDLNSELHPDTAELAAALTELEAAEDEAADQWASIEGMQDDGERAWCGKHAGWQKVTEMNTYKGFAGGTCYWWLMACGCQSADESADVEAAR